MPLVQRLQDSPLEEGVVKQEYSLGEKTRDMAITFNTGVAGSVMHTDREMQEDYFSKNNVVFNQDTYKEALSQEENPFVKEHMGYVRSHKEYNNRRQNLLRKQEAEKNVEEHVSTAGKLIGGLALSIIDVDAPLIGGIYKAGKAVKKASGVSTRLSKSIIDAGTGGTIGVASMGTYNAVTGMPYDDHLAEAALVGTALGGGLGLLMNKVSPTAPINKDEAEKLTRSKNDVKIEIVKATEKVQELSKKLETEETVLKDLKGSNAASNKVIKTLLKDRKLATKDLGVLRKQLDEVEELKTAAKEVKATEPHVETITENISGLELAYRDTMKALKSMRKKVTAFDKGREDLAMIEPQLVEDISMMQSQLNSIKGELAANKDKLKSHNKTKRKHQALIRRVSKHTKKDETKALIDTVKAIEESVAAGRKSLDKTLDEYGVLEKSLKDHKLELGKQKTWVQTLQDELTEMEKVANIDSREQEILIEGLNVPTWMKHLFISPLMKVHASGTPRAKAITSLLFSTSVALYNKTGEAVASYRGTADHLVNVYSNIAAKGIDEVRGIYKDAVAEGKFSGTFDEFEIAVAAGSREYNSKVIEDVFTTNDFKSLTPEEAMELLVKKIDTTGIKSDTGNSAIDKAVEAHLKIYSDYALLGKDLGVDTFRNVALKGYAPRIYDASKILQLGRTESIDLLVDSQVSYSRLVGTDVDDVLLKEFRAKATTAIDSAIKGTQEYDLLMNSLKTPVKHGTSRLASRTINVLDSDIGHLLSDNISLVSERYSRSLSGKFALKKTLGTYDMNDITNIIEDATTDVSHRNYLQAMVETIAGTREQSKNPFSHESKAINLITGFSGLMHQMGFGLTSTTELSNIVAKTGFEPLLEKHFKVIDEVKEMALHKSSHRDIPAIQDALNLGIIGKSKMQHAAMRVEMEQQVVSGSKIQETLDTVNHKMSMWGGLLPVTDALTLLSVGSGMNWFIRLANKGELTATEKTIMARVGMKEQDLLDLQKVNKLGIIKRDANGYYHDFNGKEWDKIRPGLFDDVMESLSTHTRSNILHPNGATLPLWATEHGWISKVMLQYTRFPIDAYEKLLLNGMNEFDAKQAIGQVVNVALWTTVLTIRDSMKIEDKERYTGEDDAPTAIKDAIGMNNLISPVTTLVDKASSAVTGKNVFNSFNPGAGAWTGPGVQAIQNAANGKPSGVTGTFIDHTMKLTGMHDILETLNKE